MKRIIRKLEKDLLIKERKGMGGIGFQDVQYAIEKGDILAKFKNDMIGFTVYVDREYRGLSIQNTLQRKRYNYRINNSISS